MKRETLQPDDQLVITDRECASVKHWMIDAMWNLCAGARFFHSANHAPHVQLQGQRAQVSRRTSSSDSMAAPSVSGFLIAIGIQLPRDLSPPPLGIRASGGMTS